MLIGKEHLHDLYRGEVKHADEEIGRFFAQLKADGLYDNALVIVTADHGEEFFEHGGWWHGTTLYDEQVHVPLLVKLPNNARAGTRGVRRGDPCTEGHRRSPGTARFCTDCDGLPLLPSSADPSLTSPAWAAALPLLPRASRPPPVDASSGRCVGTCPATYSVVPASGSTPCSAGRGRVGEA
jgi:hypothetical protein